MRIITLILLVNIIGCRETDSSDQKQDQPISRLEYSMLDDTQDTCKQNHETVIPEAYTVWLVLMGMGWVIGKRL